MINFNKLLNKWTKTINASCLSPLSLIELTNHMRSHSVWLSTAPKLEKCVTCRRWICYVYVMYIFFFSLFSSLCLVMLDHSRRYFCITQATRLWMFFLSHWQLNQYCLNKIIFILLQLLDLFFLFIETMSDMNNEIVWRQS